MAVPKISLKSILELLHESIVNMCTFHKIKIVKSAGKDGQSEISN